MVLSSVYRCLRNKILEENYINEHVIVEKKDNS